MAEIIFLGTGPTAGVKREGEIRTNSSIIITKNKKNLLIDCTPNFLEQIRKENIYDIDVVILTHAHHDAIGGLEDLDNWIKHRVSVFAPPRVLANERVDKKFNNLVLIPLPSYKSTKIENFRVTPFRVIHYEYHPTLGNKFPAYGYLIDNIAYAEDMESIPLNSEKYFASADVLVIDAAMWFEKQIRGHMNVAQSIQLVKKYNPTLAVLIQAGNTYPSQNESEKKINKYAKINGIDSDIILAYDGLRLNLDEELAELELEEFLLKQAFGSPSGKSRLVKKLMKFVPEYKTYAEVFAGGAALYWNLEKKEKEILNDLDSEIAFAYEFIKNINEEKINELKQKNWTGSRELFFKLRDSKPTENIERFYRFVYVTKLSYATDRSSYYGDNVTEESIKKYLDNLFILKERMTNTEIYNKDYAEIIKEVDSPDTFFYLDPPYPEVREFQLPKFTQEDYQKMHDLLKNIKGKFMFSTNARPWIKDMFSNFNIHRLSVVRSRDQKRKFEFEYLITNYNKSETNESLTETGSGNVQGSPITGGGLQPIAFLKPKKKKIKIDDEEMSENAKELYNTIKGGELMEDIIPKEGKSIPIDTSIEDELRKNEDALRRNGFILDQVTEDLDNLKSFLDNFKQAILIKDFISLVGSQVKRQEDHNPNDYDIHVRMDKDKIADYLERAIRVRLIKMIGENTELADQLHIFAGDASGGHDSFVPLYDLVLIPTERKIVDMMEQDSEIADHLHSLETKKKLSLDYYSPQKPQGSAFYEIDELLKKIDPDKTYFVEFKFNGFHCVVLKEDNKIKIFSEQGKDLTSAFPTLVESIKKLSDEDFAVDGELVPYDENGKALGRNALMKYVGSIKSGAKVDDSNIKLHIWDITYIGKGFDKYYGPLIKYSLKNRIYVLDKLNFSDRITNTERKIVKGGEIESAINWASKLEGSEGAVIKDSEAPYTNGESSSWIKFRHLTPIDVQIIKVVPKERDLYNYLVGVPATKEFLNPKYIENGLLVLGHTFNTKEKYETRDKITILIEEIWRHEDPEGVHYSIHKPRVEGKTDKLSTIDYLEDIVTSIGVAIRHSIIENSEVLEFDRDIEYIELKDAEGKEINPRDFPDLMQEAFRKSIGKSYDYVLQWHYRGHTITDEDRKQYNIPEKYKWWLKSLHTDNRFDNASGMLMGITLLSPTSTDKSVPDLVNQNMENVRAVLKLPQPKEWLTYEGIRHLGEAGTTSGAPAVMIIVGKGKYVPLEIEDHKLIVEFSPDEGKINLDIIKKVDEAGIYIDRLPEGNLKKLPKKVSYHIAHIGEKHLILVDRLKE